MATQRRVRLAHVALAAGVSQSQASRALNNIGQVNEQTRKRVLQAAKELGYQANPVAKELRVGAGKPLAGMIADPGNLRTHDRPGTYWFRGIATMVEGLSKAGFAPIILPLESAELCNSLSMKAVIVHSSSNEAIAAVRDAVTAPLVAFGDGEPDDHLRGLVRYDDVAVMNDACSHLLHSGATRIALVVPTEEGDHPLSLIDAYEQWCVEHELEPAIHVADGEDQLRAEIGEVLDAGVDGVFAITPLAAELVSAVKGAGRSIPDDVHLVLYGTVDVVAESLSPPVTSIDLLPEKSHRIAVDVVRRVANGEQVRALMPHRLVVRGTTNL